MVTAFDIRDFGREYKISSLRLFLTIPSLSPLSSPLSPQATMLHLTTLLALAASASAHYTFPSLIAAGASTPEWKYVRQWTNYQSNGPVTDVSKVDIRCNVGGATKQASGIQSVAAGSKVGFTAAPDIYHPGPLMAYMAKAPAGKTAADWDGSGSVWFKIFEQGPNFGSSLTWPSNGLFCPFLTDVFDISPLSVTPPFLPLRVQLTPPPQASQKQSSQSPPPPHQATTSSASNTSVCTRHLEPTEHSSTFLVPRSLLLMVAVGLLGRLLRFRVLIRRRIRV